jgi:uncharacterized membrane protein
MESLLHEVARHLALAIDAIAILVIAIGVIEALIATFRVMVGGRASHFEKRGVAGLRALAGRRPDVPARGRYLVQTAIAPTWDEVGRVAAIAAIRTFLTYFLDRDMDAMRELQRRSAGGESDAKRA